VIMGVIRDIKVIKVTWVIMIAGVFTVITVLRDSKANKLIAL
jgi:hypothetical protein